MTSKSESPAPPPCEACRLYDGSNSRYFLDAEMREALFASHHDQQDTLLAAKDAEIAELRAAIGKPYWRESPNTVDGWVEIPRWYLERILRVLPQSLGGTRAALAPKSSAGGGGD